MRLTSYYIEDISIIGHTLPVELTLATATYVTSALR
jgi:hypothetical protein